MAGALSSAAHYWTFFNLPVYGTAEPCSATIAEQGTAVLCSNNPKNVQ